MKIFSPMLQTYYYTILVFQSLMYLQSVVINFHAK
jgi:hypothetical protein